MKKPFVLLIAIACACGIFSAPVLAAAPEGRAILVLDASGSMWGQIDGKNKITIAREVIGGLVKDWDENVELGLVAYGHRSEGDCGDIETLVPVGGGTMSKISKAVNGLNPKGKTPLSASVKKAAEDLKYTDEQATVILVTDGIETCDMDPCALGKALEESGADFTTHVIGFDMKPEELAPLKCLAESTGGTFFSAGDAGSLKTALGEAAKNVRGKADRIYAIADDSDKPYEKDVYWSLFKAGADGKAEGEKLDSGASPAWLIRQPPGKYIVRGEIRGSSAAAETLVEIKEKETQEHVLDLRVGTAVLGATMNGAPVTQDVYWDAYKIGADGVPEKSKAAGTVGNKTARLELPPGQYRVKAWLRDQNLYAETDILIEAGQETAGTTDFKLEAQ